MQATKPNLDMPKKKKKKKKMKLIAKKIEQEHVTKSFGSYLSLKVWSWDASLVL